jgi:hypothetical protein
VDEELVFGNEDNENYFGTNTHGVLVIQDIDEDTQERDNQDTIDIIQASDLEKELPKLLREEIEI